MCPFQQNTAARQACSQTATGISDEGSTRHYYSDRWCISLYFKKDTLRVWISSLAKKVSWDSHLWYTLPLARLSAWESPAAFIYFQNSPTLHSDLLFLTDILWVYSGESRDEGGRGRREEGGRWVAHLLYRWVTLSLSMSSVSSLMAACSFSFLLRSS